MKSELGPSVMPRGVVTFLLRKVGAEHEVLLLKRNGGSLNGHWHPVTGGIEAGETAWQAALREVEEETGLVSDRFYSANLVESYYDPVVDAIELLPVFVGFLDAPQEVRLDEEHSDHRWVALPEALEAIRLPSLRGTLSQVVENFVDRPPLERLRIPGGP